MSQAVVVSFARAIPWKPSPEMPTPARLRVRGVTQNEQHTLVDIVIFASSHTETDWHLLFEGCTALSREPAGFPGNRPLIRPQPDWTRPLLAYDPNRCFWEIEHSTWLPGCETEDIDVKSLHHFVLYDTRRHQAWHLAAQRCTAYAPVPSHEDHQDRATHLLAFEDGKLL